MAQQNPDAVGRTSCIIEDLPDSLLIKIFQSLSLEDICLGARQTCKHWNELSLDMTLWQQLDLSMKADTLSDKSLFHILSEVGDHVETLNLQYCKKLTDDGFYHERLACDNLHRINVSNTNITDLGLQGIVCKYPQLQSLVCHSCPYLMKVYFVLQNCTNLKELYDPYESVALEHPEDVNECLEAIAQSNRGLEAVRIGFQSLDDSRLVSLCRLCTGIHTLEIPNCMWINGEALVAAVGGLPELRSLDVSGTTIRDSDIAQVARVRPGLSSVNVSMCRRITDVGIAALVRHCLRIERLVLNNSTSTTGNITNVGLGDVGQKSANLHEIHLCFCPSVTDQGIEELAKGCPQLKVVHLTGCLSLNNASLQALADHCPKLETVIAGQCVQFTSASVNKLMTQCQFLLHLALDTCHGLHRLDFDGSDHVRSSRMQTTSSQPGTSFTARPLKLQVLDLAFCSKLIPESATQLARHCHSLQSLTLRGCYLMNDIAIATIVKGCKNLLMLDISGGSSVQASTLTDHSLISIAKHCNNLVMLSAEKNSSMTTAGVKAVVSGCRTLKRLAVTVGKGVVLPEVLNFARDNRRSCGLKNFNTDYVHTETRGEFIIHFPPIRYPSV